MDSLNFLQHYWWAVVTLLGALLVFLLFVQGMQSLLLLTAADKAEKDLVVRYAGHKWEITFTTLVTFGGAAFASFPLFYATSFGGAYWLWIAILLLFVIQAVSFEFRDAAGNLAGPRTFEIFLFLNGSLGTFLLGAAVATLFTGGPFLVEKSALTDTAAPAVSRWANGWHGLDVLAEPFNLLLGTVVYFAARTLGQLYILSRAGRDTGEAAERLQAKCRRQLPVSAAIFVLTFAAFLVCLLLLDGYRPSETGAGLSPVSNAYARTMLEHPWIGVLLLAGTGCVLAGLIFQLRRRRERSNFYLVGAGTVLAVWAILLSAGFGSNAYFISTADPQMSLTLANSSSSLFTLRVMAYVSIAVPFVVAYIAWAWKSLK